MAHAVGYFREPAGALTVSFAARGVAVDLAAWIRGARQRAWIWRRGSAAQAGVPPKVAKTANIHAAEGISTPLDISARFLSLARDSNTF